MIRHRFGSMLAALLLGSAAAQPDNAQRFPFDADDRVPACRPKLRRKKAAERRRRSLRWNGSQSTRSRRKNRAHALQVRAKASEFGTPSKRVRFWTQSTGVDAYMRALGFALLMTMPRRGLEQAVEELYELFDFHSEGDSQISGMTKLNTVQGAA
jgi:hypothetical protein